MYRDFYHLKDEPFNITPDPRFLYLTPQHQEALDEIYSHSQGMPRLVNAISDKALLAGYVHRAGLIDRRIVQLALGDLKEAC